MLYNWCMASFNAASGMGTPGKILLVDDDPDTRDIYGEFLTAAGYEVDFAKDGQEGLAKILQGGYDLVLLDIMMPKIDGLGILKRLKEISSNSLSYNGPIIVLSVLDQEYFVDQALKLGAKGFLPKSGLTPEEALDKIVEFLKSSPKTQQ